MIQFIGKNQVLLTDTCLTDGYYLEIIKALMLVVGHTDLDVVDNNVLSLLMMLAKDLLPADFQIEMERCAKNPY